VHIITISILSILHGLTNDKIDDIVIVESGISDFYFLVDTFSFVYLNTCWRTMDRRIGKQGKYF